QQIGPGLRLLAQQHKHGRATPADRGRPAGEVGASGDHGPAGQRLPPAGKVGHGEIPRYRRTESSKVDTVWAPVRSSCRTTPWVSTNNVTGSALRPQALSKRLCGSNRTG